MNSPEEDRERASRRVRACCVRRLEVMGWSPRCASGRTRFVLHGSRWSRTPRRLAIDLKEPLLIDSGGCCGSGPRRALLMLL